MLKKLRENSLAMAGVAIMGLVAAGGLLYVQLAPASQAAIAPERYFYDEAAKSLIVRDGVLAPFKINEGDAAPTGVGVRVMSCGSCKDESSRFIAYLEKYTPEAHEKLSAMGLRNYQTPPEEEADESGNYEAKPSPLLVRRENDANWVPLTSAFLEGIAREAGAKCGGSVPRNCDSPSSK